jgi:hypothetical protein
MQCDVDLYFVVDNDDDDDFVVVVVVSLTLMWASYCC